MKKIYILIISLLVSAFAISQNNSKYFVRFTDKNNSPYSISNPLEFLSQKALDRRAKSSVQIQQNDIPVNPFYVDSLKKIGAVVLHTSRWFNAATVFISDSNLVNQISSASFVKSVQCVAKETSKKKKGNKSTNGTILGSLSLDESISSNNYGLAYNQANMIAVNYLHDLGYSGTGVTIAVLDAGFVDVDTLLVFDSLWKNNQVLGSYDFVDPGENALRKGTHGLNVLSTMAANYPFLMVGTAPKANYWLLRSEDTHSEQLIEECNWLAAAEFADSVGADIITSSLGYTTFDDPVNNHTYQEMDGNTTIVTRAADLAASKGILVVNSAGNSGIKPWRYIGAPGDGDSVLTVGAVDYKGNYAIFSSKGPSSDGMIKPNVCGLGQQATIANLKNVISTGNGTSFSTPIVAGAVACLLQACPDKTNMEIIKAVEESSSQFYAPDSLKGYGIPNFYLAYLILSQRKIDDFDKENSVTILPNPFIDDFHIIFLSTDTLTVKVELFDLTGKRVFYQENMSRHKGYNYAHVQDLSNLAKGYYILRLSSESNLITKKLLKYE
ncbi:MAG: S8 family serine peptidase [Saprospiraceae bacterium]|nr:S8 family serine peptidase [Saprospiraceae bacterium]